MHRPDGLPDHLLGGSDRETIDKLFGAFDGFRRAQSEIGAVPKEPSAYKLEPSDKLKPYVANLEQDGLFSGVREDALKAGITDKQFNKFLGPVLERMMELPGFAGIDYQKELANLTPPEAKSLDEAGRKAAVNKRIETNLAWIEGARAQNMMPKEIADTLITRLGDDARGHQAIEWMRAQGRERGPALDGKGAGAVASDADLKARNIDPRNNPNSPTFDRAFAAETDRLFQQRYG